MSEGEGEGGMLARVVILQQHAKILSEPASTYQLALSAELPTPAPSIAFCLPHSTLYAIAAWSNAPFDGRDRNFTKIMPVELFELKEAQVVKNDFPL